MNTILAFLFSLVALVHVGPENIYPNPAITPGMTNPAVTQANIQQTICVPSWVKNVRPSVEFTNRVKAIQFKQYSINLSQMDFYEEDHFIPLETGGMSNDPRNLWPEPWGDDAHPLHRTEKYAGIALVGGAHLKDHVENAMHRDVCSGKITLVEAQQRIQQDWWKEYLAIKAGKR